MMTEYPGYARVAASFNCSSVNRGPDPVTMIGSRVAAAASSLRQTRTLPVTLTKSTYNPTPIPLHM